MAEKKIRINVKTDSGYDQLYPESKSEIIDFDNSDTDLSSKNLYDTTKEINNKIGFLSNLKTSVKTSVISAINDIYDKIIGKTLSSIDEVNSNSQKGYYVDALAVKEISNITSENVFTNRFKTGKVYKCGNIKRILLLDSTVNFHAGQEYDLGTLPADYRPVQKFEKYMIIAGNQSVTYIARLVIQTNGTVMFYPFVERPVDSVIVIDESYI